MNRALFGCCCGLVLFVLPSAVLAQTGAAPAAPADVTASPAPRAVRPLAVDDAVARALSTNPARRSSALAAEQAKQNVRAELGRYPYVLQGDAGHTRRSSPRLGAGDTIGSNVSRSYTVGAALRRTFPLGTTAELRVQGERFENEIGGGASADLRGEGYAVVGRAALSQPLLRGAGRRIGELELRAARVESAGAEQAVQRVTSELVRDVLTAYWELWYADEAVRIEQASLVLARQQEREAQIRIEQGALAPADVLTFSTRVAQLEESLVGAEAQTQQRSGELSMLLGDVSGSALAWGAASQPPPAQSVTSRADVEAALREGSIELAELETRVRALQTRGEAAGESSRARLDFEGYLESQGLSERAPRAFGRAAELNWVTAHVGVVGELPLDTSRGDAERASALLSVHIAQQELKAARDRITAQASFAVSNESALLRRVELSLRTLEVATRAYEAERARFELGQSIPVQVQQAEEEVRRARLRVARARVDLVEQQIAVLHLSGRLLERYLGS